MPACVSHESSTTWLSIKSPPKYPSPICFDPPFFWMVMDVQYVIRCLLFVRNQNRSINILWFGRCEPHPHHQQSSQWNLWSRVGEIFLSKRYQFESPSHLLLSFNLKNNRIGRKATISNPCFQKSLLVEVRSSRRVLYQNVGVQQHWHKQDGKVLHINILDYSVTASAAAVLVFRLCCSVFLDYFQVFAIRGKIDIIIEVKSSTKVRRTSSQLWFVSSSTEDDVKDGTFNEHFVISCKKES